MVPDVQEPAPIVTAVVAALAGVRNGQTVVVLGPGTRLRAALEAGTGVPLAEVGPADVVVALGATDVPGAVGLLRPGGRLVALAADHGAVERSAARYGLVVRHLEAVDGRIAWSASLRT